MKQKLLAREVEVIFRVRRKIYKKNLSSIFSYCVFFSLVVFFLCCFFCTTSLALVVFFFSWLCSFHIAFLIFFHIGCVLFVLVLLSSHVGATTLVTQVLLPFLDCVAIFIVCGLIVIVTLVLPFLWCDVAQVSTSQPCCYSFHFGVAFISLVSLVFFSFLSCRLNIEVIKQKNVFFLLMYVFLVLKFRFNLFCRIFLSFSYTFYYKIPL